MPLPKPLDVFYSYAHEDGSYRDMLNTHLSLLRRQGLIRQWSDRDITGGMEWDPEILRKLEEAHIILLLISADFLASDFIWNEEMKRAMERHAAGQARVIPIILRECDWPSARRSASCKHSESSPCCEPLGRP